MREYQIKIKKPGSKEMSENDLKPEILEFEIGAYQSDSYRMEWRDDYMVLETGYSHGFFENKVIIRPLEENWKVFWKKMENIYVWQWSPRYSAAVCDGTSWSLKLKYKNQFIDTYGHMAYPDPDDVRRMTEIEVSKPFKKLIRALDALCNKRHFSNF